MRVEPGLTEGLRYKKFTSRGKYLICFMEVVYLFFGIILKVIRVIIFGSVFLISIFLEFRCRHWLFKQITVQFGIFFIFVRVFFVGRLVEVVRVFARVVRLL